MKCSRKGCHTHIDQHGLPMHSCCCDPYCLGWCTVRAAVLAIVRTNDPTDAVAKILDFLRENDA